MNNTKQTQFIFVHGGPGLNSKPERELLAPNLKEQGFDILFWDEPQDFHSKNTYNEIVLDLVNKINQHKQDVCLIGHSFGARIVIDALKSNRITSKIKSTLFLSPALDMCSGDDKIINYGLSKLETLNPEVASTIKKHIPNLINDQFDDLKGETLLLAFQSGYFVENFINPSDFEKYFSYFQNEFSFRVEDHVAIRKVAGYLKDGNNDFKQIKNTTIVGTNDPIFNDEAQLSMTLSYFPNATIQKWDTVSHYPHMDATAKFLELLKENA
jgi:pimeloyl-ACP methyl ester carboxylesterase